MWSVLFCLANYHVSITNIQMFFCVFFFKWLGHYVTGQFKDRTEPMDWWMSKCLNEISKKITHKILRPTVQSWPQIILQICTHRTPAHASWCLSNTLIKPENTPVADYGHKNALCIRLQFPRQLVFRFLSNSISTNWRSRRQRSYCIHSIPFDLLVNLFWATIKKLPWPLKADDNFSFSLPSLWKRKQMSFLRKLQMDFDNVILMSRNSTFFLIF